MLALPCSGMCTGAVISVGEVSLGAMPESEGHDLPDLPPGLDGTQREHGVSLSDMCPPSELMSAAGGGAPSPPASPGASIEPLGNPLASRTDGEGDGGGGSDGERIASR